MKKWWMISFVFALLIASCSQDYVCVCEVPAEDTILTQSTEFRGLKSEEAEVERQACEIRSFCYWDEVE